MVFAAARHRFAQRAPRAHTVRAARVNTNSACFASPQAEDDGARDAWVAALERVCKLGACAHAHEGDAPGREEVHNPLEAAAPDSRARTGAWTVTPEPD